MNLRQLVGKRQPLVYALLGVIACLCNLGMAELDDDPKTSPDWGSVVAVVLVAVGAAKARQNNVSSEEAGAKDDPARGSLTGTYDRLGVIAAIAAIGLLTLGGCNQTPQRTEQRLPSSQRQIDEQAANIAIVQTTNVYPAGTLPSDGAQVIANADGWYEGKEAVLKAILPDGRQVEMRAGISTVATQTVSVNTSGQSEKEGAQTGATSQSETTATPTNTPTISPTLDIPVNLTPGAGSSVNLAPGT
jgi:hypothetical protein